jgi:hypothetical protein
MAEKEYGSDPNNIKNEYFELAGQPYLILDAIMESYIIRSTMVWPRRIKDEDVLRRLIAIVFVRITNLISHHVPKITVEDTDYFSDMFMSFKLQGTKYLKQFTEFSKKFGLEKEIDPVLDDIWNMNKEVQLFAYPEPRLLFWKGFNYGKDDWRKLLEVVDKHGGQTIAEFRNMPINGLLNKDKDEEG